MYVNFFIIIGYIILNLIKFYIQEKEKEEELVMQNGIFDILFNMNVVKVGINGIDSDICIFDEMIKISVWKYLIVNEFFFFLNSNSSSIK